MKYEPNCIFDLNGYGPVKVCVCRVLCTRMQTNAPIVLHHPSTELVKDRPLTAKLKCVLSHLSVCFVCLFVTCEGCGEFEGAHAEQDVCSVEWRTFGTHNGNDGKARRLVGLQHTPHGTQRGLSPRVHFRFLSFDGRQSMRPATSGAARRRRRR